MEKRPYSKCEKITCLSFAIAFGIFAIIGCIYGIIITPSISESIKVT